MMLKRNGYSDTKNLIYGQFGGALIDQQFSDFSLSFASGCSPNKYTNVELQDRRIKHGTSTIKNQSVSLRNYNAKQIKMSFDLTSGSRMRR